MAGILQVAGHLTFFQLMNTLVAGANPLRHRGSREPDPRATGLSAIVHRYLPVMALCVELLSLALPSVELFTHFSTSSPALVLNVKTTQSPGNVVIETQFKNLNRNWPLEKVAAKWELETDDVKLAIDNAAPPHSINAPTPTTRSVVLTEPLKANGRFSAFLQATHAFQIFRQEYDAFYPKVENFGVTYTKVEVLTQQEWEERNRFPWFYGLLFLGLVIVVTFTVTKLVRRLGGVS